MKSYEFNYHISHPTEKFMSLEHMGQSIQE